MLKRVDEAYEDFLETRTFHYPSWLYGNPIGTLVTLPVEDCPNSGTPPMSKWTQHERRSSALTCKSISAARTVMST